MHRKFFAMAWFVLMAVEARATRTQWEVNWDTAPIRDGYYEMGPNTRYYVGFELTNGGRDYSTFARFSNFQFGGGAPTGVEYRAGLAQGSPLGTFQLWDVEFYNAYVFEFRPGSALSFHLNLLDVGNEPGPFPDTLSFALYRSPESAVSNGVLDLAQVLAIGTYDPLTFIASARADVKDNLTWETFDSFSSSINDSFYVPKPVITEAAPPEAVPEPTTLALVGAGLVVLSLRRRP